MGSTKFTIRAMDDELNLVIGLAAAQLGTSKTALVLEILEDVFAPALELYQVMIKDENFEHLNEKQRQLINEWRKIVTRKS